MHRPARSLPTFTIFRRSARRRKSATSCRFPPFSAARPICCSPPDAPAASVNVKKGQFLSPWEIGNAAEKIASTGNEKIILTERGSSFGYQNLVVDMRSFPIMRKFGYPIVFDVTHSVQLPGGEGKSSGGQPEFIEPLARAGAAVGVDGMFLEVHDNPAEALSDGAERVAARSISPAAAKNSASRGARARMGRSMSLDHRQARPAHRIRSHRGADRASR